MTASTTLYGSFSVFKQEGIRQFYCRWSQKEDDLLIEAIKKYGCHKWSLISQSIPGRTPAQCSTRWHGALNSKVHKGRWSTEEDDILLDAVRNYLNQDAFTTNNLPWNLIAEQIPHRTGIQCQSRWTEALDPAVRKGRWSKEEDELLRQAVHQLGCCWIRVAGCIPSRTQRQCRTRWNQIKNTRQPKQRQQQSQLATKSSSISHNKHRRPSLPSSPTLLSSSSPANITTSKTPSIPAMIIPASDFVPSFSIQSSTLSSISSSPTSSSSSSSLSSSPSPLLQPSFPHSIPSITIPKDPFPFLLDHDMTDSFYANDTSSICQDHHVDPSLTWFYGTSPSSS
ncbi:Homeodomain-like protein [Halteromyces radiatus]|uniref:Homeodomain-like protein n=1 Tax=Halteromyces radiatus TaxID=101107 RepID=UPI0022208227|nr:Homeodomain-like protein [Halteromyces radiatus]KAI8077723.1 Homeodomain-like protein [Halteromyces radiatus]